jgi:hypothetical protein
MHSKNKNYAALGLWPAHAPEARAGRSRRVAGIAANQTRRDTLLLRDDGPPLQRPRGYERTRASGA